MRLRFVPPAILLALAGTLAAVVPAAAQQRSIHQDGFNGRTPTFVRGDANIKFAEKDHAISREHGKSGLTSEMIKIEANPPAGAVEAEYVHYYYATPPAPVTEQLTASVYLKSLRAGAQIKVRVVFPREKDPQNPDAPLTTLLAGDKYHNVRQWQKLGFLDLTEAVKKHLPVLHARLGRAVDPTGAYVDRIVLNVYSGPGVSEVFVDDLEIGPVRPAAAPPAADPRQPAAPAGRPGQPGGRPRRVEFTDGQIFVEHDDGEMRPFLMLAVRHTGTPLKVLRDAQFNTVWFPAGATPDVLEEAIRHGFWIVPTVPLPAGEWDARQPKKPDPVTIEQDAKEIAGFLRKFLSTDAVLMWDLGGERSAEELPRVARIADVVRQFDPRRPRTVDVWDGFQVYSTYVNAVGAHRWPLFSSLEIAAYRDWLAQRRALVPPGKMTWTWIQTHLPDWYVHLLTGRTDVVAFDDPIGPHPEQIRVLTYLSLAAGHRGLGFWSDRFLENPCHGRDRLLELALLNAEIEMLKPVLVHAQDSARWVPTNHPAVQAAILRGPRELIVLPVWVGAGTQHTPAQAVVPTLKVTIPAVPESSVPWLVTPAGVTELKGLRRVPGGTEIEISEFDTSAAIVFTDDYKANGKIVRWQDHTKFRLAESAARWAREQAVEQFNKALATHTKIVRCGGPDLPESGELFAQARHSLKLAEDFYVNRQYDVSYREARRALRPLRVLMRGDWEAAVKTLDTPTASPFAVSFYSLPQHWQFAREVQASRPGGNAFPNGGFELSKPAPDAGAAVTSLPGWKVRKMILDPANGVAAIINTSRDGIKDPPPQPPPYDPTRYGTGRVAPQPIEFRQPEFGQHCLLLATRAQVEKDRDGTPLPPPQAVERTVLAVDSPPAEFAPGSIVRISFWVKIAASISASADGLIVFDSAGGEPLGVRLTNTTAPGKPPVWRQFHLYRRVPADGKIAMTFALTGLGTVYIDDVRMEPLIPHHEASAPPPAGPVHPAGGATHPPK